MGDVLSGTTTGVLDYDSFGGYNLQATELGTLTDHHLQREVTRKQKGKELAVATYNVENLDALDEQGKFDTLAAGVAVNLSSPDIVSLEEIQDDNGAVNDGTVGSDADAQAVHRRDRGGGRPAGTRGATSPPRTARTAASPAATSVTSSSSTPSGSTSWTARAATRPLR